MKVVVQRVLEASVSISGAVHSEIGNGLLVLLGITHDDTKDDIDWLVRKLIQLRIFNDTKGVMNSSIQEVGGDFLVISQFTLHASTKKGNRPSYMQAAGPDTAVPLYEKFVETLQNQFGKNINTGIFGADMKVTLINDGPVTIIIDSKNKT